MSPLPAPLPPFWLTQPERPSGPDHHDFEALERAGLSSGVVHCPEAVPVWAFLCWLCDQRGYVAHGTGQADITTFEPRQSNDVGSFGNRTAVYASSDGIWAMFFAVMNRPQVPMTVVNAAITAHLDGGPVRLYFFGASRHALETRAYRAGWVYLLPARTFEREAEDEASGLSYTSHHCASLEAVRPAFRVAVRPDDFPFLDRLHAYDEEQLSRASRDHPGGFPWLDDE